MPLTWVVLVCALWAVVILLIVLLLGLIRRIADLEQALQVAGEGESGTKPRPKAS